MSSLNLQPKMSSYGIWANLALRIFNLISSTIFMCKIKFITCPLIQFMWFCLIWIFQKFKIRAKSASCLLWTNFSHWKMGKTQFLALICPTAWLAAQPHFSKSGWSFKGLVGDVGAMSGESFGEIGWGTAELRAENCRKTMKKRDFCPTLPNGPAHSSAVPGPIRLKFLWVGGGCWGYVWWRFRQDWLGYGRATG